MPTTSHSPASAGYPDPFVADILADARGHDCRTYAIAGLQGTGKSTLSAQMADMAASLGRRVVALSIDDFYLGHAARQELGHRVHPLCATRGAPGTHDVALACEVLDSLRAQRPTALPRFDKIADDRLPESQWPTVQRADMVILEGWFLKVPPQSDAELREPLNALERDEDPDGVWRSWSNEALARDYPPLWSRLDRLLFLQGPGFEIVPQWRWQQEQTLQAAHPDRQAMSREQVERFVQFFERVSRQAMRTLPGIADRTIRLDAQRHPIGATSHA
ncbi:kinase [Cognatiluteimonas profundi]|uniref:kinase n=1 Tax=Cognatiluteimonas profundi TaxID=2594501 RepID=UPI0018EEE5FD|nr:kinase [Lysobacter profundi]